MTKEGATSRAIALYEAIAPSFSAKASVTSSMVSVVYALPTGSELSEEQRRELDDTFLSSDPFSYFKARIAMMLHWAAVSDEATLPAPMTGFGLHLRNPRMKLEHDPEAADLQLATDAFALRQHTAESLLRLIYAILDHQERPETSLWECLSAGPFNLKDVVKSTKRSLTADEFPGLADLLLADGDNAAERVDQLWDQLLVFESWYNFSMDMVNDDPYRFNTANNKLKHGPAVRARDDIRSIFTLSDPALPDGRLSLSTLTGPEAHDFINEPIIEVLAQAKRQGHRVWEVSQIILDTELMLSEAYMIAWTHAAIFANAASRHFRDREGLRGPEFPGYPPAGIKPTQRHLQQRLQVFRIPLTVPQGAKTEDAKHVIVHRDSYVDVKVEAPLKGLEVVDDTGSGATRP